MKLSRVGKINYLNPRWAAKTGFTGGFTTRNGGVSRAPYNSLNLGLKTEDATHAVEGNRSSLARAFDLPPHLLLTIQQTHGNDILLLDQHNPDLHHFHRVEADAIICNQKNLLFGVLVADCFPVLLWDAEKHVGAAVHAGWRGAANGLIGKTVEAMITQFGCEPATLYAAVGPGIGANHYEVDRPVRQAFEQGSGFWHRIATEVDLGRWRLDLRESCRLQLDAAGLIAEQIDLADENTYDNKELFFSHRRDGGTTGRQMGFIVL